MKKQVIKYLFLITLFMSHITNIQAQYSLGGGLSITDVIQNSGRLGMSARGMYSFNEQLRAAAIINVPFPEETIDGVDIVYLGIHLNGQYFTPLTQELGIYGLVGGNYLMSRADIGNDVTFNSGFGIDVGAGVEYIFNRNITAYAEPKYVLLEESGFSLHLGVLYHF